jgi:FKBP-type peptidyl-prolyl cis-trans isomerase
MNIGLLHKKSEGKTHTDIPIFSQAIEDTLDGATPRLKESEIKPLLERVGAEGIEVQSEATKQKVSYALGMRMALQIKARYADAKGVIVAEGIHDVIDGKPTRIEPAEISAVLQQAMEWGKLKQSEKNKAAGEAFLARNAREPDVKILSDGLQYRVIKQGTGELPSTNNLVYIKLRGNFVDGKQFIHHNHYLVRCGGGCPGWQEALPKMKIGSRWQLFVPASLGFGEEGEPAWGVGPDATTIFDLEMVSIAPPDAEFGRGRLGHAFEDSDIPDSAEEQTAPGIGARK